MPTNRAAQLNDGSFRDISREIRSQVNVEFQQWILDHISARKSFATRNNASQPGHV